MIVGVENPVGTTEVSRLSCNQTFKIKKKCFLKKNKKNFNRMKSEGAAHRVTMSALAAWTAMFRGS